MGGTSLVFVPRSDQQNPCLVSDGRGELMRKDSKHLSGEKPPRPGLGPYGPRRPAAHRSRLPPPSLEGHTGLSSQRAILSVVARGRAGSEWTGAEGAGQVGGRPGSRKAEGALLIACSPRSVGSALLERPRIPAALNAARSSTLGRVAFSHQYPGPRGPTRRPSNESPPSCYRELGAPAASGSRGLRGLGEGARAVTSRARTESAWDPRPGSGLASIERQCLLVREATAVGRPAVPTPGGLVRKGALKLFFTRGEGEGDTSSAWPAPWRGGAVSEAQSPGRREEHPEPEPGGGAAGVGNMCERGSAAEGPEALQAEDTVKYERTL